ncbi:MAG: lycopene cyclase [Planctomycetia bacterium]|nr:lycopene cyclase [Planctomycetia bacterium]
MSRATRYDHVIVGGGLQGCLVSHALAHHRPEARVLLVERASDLCGNHTWSFHESDIPEQARAWFDPLVAHRWPGYLVRFPALTRRVGIPYATISSAGLREATRRLAAEAHARAGRGALVIRSGAACEIVSPTCVRLGDGALVDGATVIDCRGRAAAPGPPRGAGYQSFIGHEFRVGRRWPAAEPTVMDVREDQASGFEFLYELPFGPDRVLLEYTRFSEDPGCDEARAEALIATRLAEAGAHDTERLRTERGCLPMPYEAPARAPNAAVAGGYAGGWYHAATGYSMPLAARFADILARAAPDRVGAELAAAAAGDSLRRGFARFLNRLLFCLVTPRDRWKIFRRFYRVLSEERISRFYAHRFTVADAARIVVGRPPSGLAPLRFARSFLSPTGPGLT